MAKLYIMSVLKIFVLLFFSICAVFPNWYSDWSFRKAITNNLAIGGDLTNFPLLVVISNDADLNSYASNNGYDILFTLSNGQNKLDHEIEYYSAGTLIAWVKIPYFSASVQSSNNLFMYFDKNKSGNQQNISGVWSGHQAVFHLSSLNDSTAIANVLASTGPSYSSGGLINDNYQFANSGKLACAALNNLNFPQTAGTISLWAKGDFASQDETVGVFDKRDNNRSHYYMRCYTATTVQLCFQTNAAYAHSASRGFLNNEWNYFVITYSTTQITHYSNNGYFISTAALATPNQPSNQYFDIGNAFTGYIDEVRLSSIVRSSNWILNEYSNQITPTACRKIGSVETFPGVIFSSITPASTPCVVGDNTVLTLDARVLTNTITSVYITWGDGSSSSYSPNMVNISAENFSYVFNTCSNFTVTAVVSASNGYVATNSTTIFTLPYRFFNPQHMIFFNDSKGCLVKWDILSSANIMHFNLYRGNDLHARIENPALREYFDECFIFGDRHTYWLEAVYPAGSSFSTTNTSDFHRVYRREALLGTGGGSLATLLAELYAPQNSLNASCTISMNIVSNTYNSFYESGKPVYHQIVLSSSDAANKTKGGLILKFRIPAQAGALSFKPADASGFTIAGHKDKLFCSFWDGKIWTALSTSVYERRMQNNFSFLELETSVNRLGIYGIMYNPQASVADQPLTVKNRIFVPGLNDPMRSSVQISFPNPNREQVKIQVFDLKGKIVKDVSFYDWISFWAWNGLDNSEKLAAPGLYIVSITVGGIRNDAHNAHVYLLK